MLTFCYLTTCNKVCIEKFMYNLKMNPLWRRMTKLMRAIGGKAQEGDGQLKG